MIIKKKCKPSFALVAGLLKQKFRDLSMSNLLQDLKLPFRYFYTEIKYSILH